MEDAPTALTGLLVGYKLGFKLGAALGCKLGKTVGANVGCAEGNCVGINLEGAIVGEDITDCEALNDVGALVVVAVGVFDKKLNIDTVGTRLGFAVGIMGTGALENAAQESPFPGSIVG